MKSGKYLHLPKTPPLFFLKWVSTVVWCVVLVSEWNRSGVLRQRWVLLWIPIVTLLIGLGGFLNRFAAGKQSRYFSRRSILRLLFGLLVTTLVLARDSSPWFYYTGLGVEPHFFKRPLVQFLLGTLLLYPVFSWRKWTPRRSGVLLCLLTTGVAGIAFITALDTLGGEVLYKTDHPSFLFRLWEFTRGFPALGGYNPLWNAGVEHFTGVSSGVQGIGLIFFPLLRWLPVHEVYNWVVLLLFLVLTPLLCGWSARLMGGGMAAISVAGLLSLGVSQQFFLWMWHFGTEGAAFSAVMVVPVLAISYRVAVLHRMSVPLFIGIWVSAFLMVMWSPLCLVMGLGLILAYIGMHGRWTQSSFLFLTGAAALCLISWLPWLRILLFPARGVLEYVSKTSPSSPPVNEMLLESGKHLITALLDAHPLLLFFGVGGLLTLKPSLRFWYLPVAGMLAVFCGWGSVNYPLSQFDRLCIPLMFVLLIPASLCIARIFQTGPGRQPFLKAGMVMLLLLGGRTVLKTYANEGPAPAQTLDPVIPEIVEWIQSEVPANGRLMFCGAALHSFGGGKIAYLPILAEREMMADDYFGFPVHTIEYNYPPKFYRKQPDRFDSFIHAYNITHVITSHDSFRAYFASRPERFQFATQFTFRGAELSAYRVIRDFPLLGRKVKVDAELNRIDITFPENIREVLLSYNWREGLVCETRGAEISPFDYDENIRLIKVISGNAGKVRIRYHLPWKPIAPNFDGGFPH